MFESLTPYAIALANLMRQVHRMSPWIASRGSGPLLAGGLVRKGVAAHGRIILSVVCRRKTSDCHARGKPASQ
jgi:hypothetical protein